MKLKTNYYLGECISNDEQSNPEVKYAYTYKVNRVGYFNSTMLDRSHISSIAWNDWDNEENTLASAHCHIFLRCPERTIFRNHGV